MRSSSAGRASGSYLEGRAFDSRLRNNHLAAALVIAVGLAACDQPPPQQRAPRTTPQVTLQQSIALPHGATASVVVVPHDAWESSRCLVVTTAAHAPAVSCSEPRVTLDPDE
jgi:hypothetical protein